MVLFFSALTSGIAPQIFCEIKNKVTSKNSNFSALQEYNEHQTNLNRLLQMWNCQRHFFKWHSKLGLNVIGLQIKAIHELINSKYTEV